MAQTYRDPTFDVSTHSRHTDGWVEIIPPAAQSKNPGKPLVSGNETPPYQKTTSKQMNRK